MLELTSSEIHSSQLYVCRMIFALDKKKHSCIQHKTFFFLIFKSRSSLRCFSSSTLVLFLSSFVVHFLLYISCLLLPILYLDWRSFRHYADSERKPEPPQTIRCMHFFPVTQQRSAGRGSSIVEVLYYTRVDKQTIRYTHTHTHTKRADSSERVINSSYRQLPTQHTTNISYEHPCPQRDSTPRSRQQAYFWGRFRLTPRTALPPRLARSSHAVSLLCSDVFLFFFFKCHNYFANYAWGGQATCVGVHVKCWAVLFDVIQKRTCH